MAFAAVNSLPLLPEGRDVRRKKSAVAKEYLYFKHHTPQMQSLKSHIENTGNFVACEYLNSSPVSIMIIVLDASY